MPDQSPLLHSENLGSRGVESDYGEVTYGAGGGGWRSPLAWGGWVSDVPQPPRPIWLLIHGGKATLAQEGWRGGLPSWPLDSGNGPPKGQAQPG